MRLPEGLERCPLVFPFRQYFEAVCRGFEEWAVLYIVEDEEDVREIFEVLMATGDRARAFRKLALFERDWEEYQPGFIQMARDWARSIAEAWKALHERERQLYREEVAA